MEQQWKNVMLVNTPKVSLGWQASPFNLPNPDGDIFSLAQLNGKNGLVVAFICNHCPYVVAIADRFAEDARQLQSENINVVAINANDYVSYPADSPANMKLFAEKYGFSFPYLIDEDQSVARAYDAVCTPDFFGFDRNGALKYRGRLDDARMNDDTNRTPELLNAMRQIAKTDAGPTEQMASMGCSIKWR